MSNLQLEEAREAAQVLADLKEKAEALPTLEKEARRAERHRLAEAELTTAKERLAEVVAEVTPAMQIYHERLEKLRGDIRALTANLEWVSSKVKPATHQIAHVCSKLAWACADEDAPSDKRKQAAVQHRIEELIGEEMPKLDVVLSPWVPGDDELNRLVNELLLPRVRDVFDPTRPTL